MTTLEAIAEPLRDLVLERSGLDFPERKAGELLDAFRRGMANTQTSDPHSYLTSLRHNPETLASFINLLTVGETYFFRNPPQMEALRERILPDLARQGAVRAWSAGCATGEEPYSLTILMRELGLGPDRSHVLASDINEGYLERARDGVYSTWSFRQTGPDVRQRHFEPAGKDRWRLLDRYREGVTFSRLNLVTDLYPEPLNGTINLDLIMCRNVTIYFPLEVTRRVIRAFFQCLRPGGWLIVGHSEPSLGIYDDFETVSAPGTVLYRRPERHLPRPLRAPEPARPTARAAASSKRSALRHARPAPAVRPRTGPASPAPAGAADLARRHADEGRFDEAGSILLEAIRRNPLDASLHLLHGLVLQNLGDVAGAIGALKKAIYLDRDFLIAHYHLMLIDRRGRLAPVHRRNVARLVAGMEADEVIPESGGMHAGELSKLLRALEGEVTP
jgi:chemotaxis protein methyltransferase CheR